MASWTASASASGVRKQGNDAQPVAFKACAASSTSARPLSLVRSPIGYLPTLTRSASAGRRGNDDGAATTQRRRSASSAAREASSGLIASRAAPVPA